MSDSSLSHQYELNYAAHLAQHHQAELIHLSASEGAHEAKTIALREKADLLIIGFTPLYGSTDEQRTAHIQPFIWNFPCPILLIPDLGMRPPTLPKTAMLLSDGRAIGASWNVTAANQLLRRWQPLITVLYWRQRNHRLWAFASVLQQLQGPAGILKEMAAVDSQLLDNADWATQLPTILKDQVVDLAIFIPRERQAHAPLNRFQKLAFLLHCPIPILVIPSS